MKTRRLIGTLAVGVVLLTSIVVPTVPAFATTGSSLTFTFRAVLCFAPELSAKSHFPLASAIPTCRSKYELTVKNLDVTPNNSVTGFSAKAVKPDPRFLHFRSTPGTRILSASEVLLPGIKGSGASERYVLGRSQLTNSDIKSAAAVKQRTGGWIVEFHLTSSGSAAWNAFAKKQFHGYFAVVANGEVYSAPLIQPENSHFFSFGSSGVVSDNFTQSEALELARSMQPSH